MPKIKIMYNPTSQSCLKEEHFRVIIILKFLCFSVFAGRAWEHMRWDPPFRSLLWDQNLMESFITHLTGLTWMQYATSPVIDIMIQNTIFSFGCFYAVCALTALFISKQNHLFYRISQFILIVGTIGLLFLAFLYCKEKFFHTGQFFEYTCQFASPLFLLYALSNAHKVKALTLTLKIAIALTFACHGLYAIGYYPIPGNWVDMFIMGLGTTEQTALKLLYIAGMLDLILSIAIFIPAFTQPTLIYLILWGFVTAISRLYVNFYPDAALQSIEQYLHEVIYRVPHFGIPLLMMILIRKEKIISFQNILPEILKIKGNIRASSGK